MKMMEYLENKVLPFWLDNAIDEEYGGIFTCLDKEGKVYGTEKSVWFQGRALYIFSLAYKNGIKDERLLRAAKKIYDFLPLCGDENGRMYFIVTREGKEIQKRRYYFSETFAAIGAAEYYSVTGCEEAWKSAEKYFDIAYALYSNPDPKTAKFNPENAPYKALSPAMIMLSTAQVLRSMNRNPEKYDKIAHEMTEEILGHWTDKGLLENITVDGKFADTPTGRIVNPGHSLEAAWFLMSEGLYRNDSVLIDMGKKITDKSMSLGLVDGGILSFCDCNGRPAQALEWDMKLWWPQCEGIIANRLCYAIFKEQKYLDNYNALKDYAFNHFGDDENGEWYGYLHYDGTVANTLKGNIFKGPFHLPRMLMLIDKIEKGDSII